MTPKQIAEALGGHWRGDSAMVRCILHDEAGLNAAGEVAKRWNRAGKKARIITPNTPGADWNDEVSA